MLSDTTLRRMKRAAVGTVAATAASVALVAATGTAATAGGVDELARTVSTVAEENLLLGDDECPACGMG